MDIVLVPRRDRIGTYARVGTWQVHGEAGRCDCLCVNWGILVDARRVVVVIVVVGRVRITRRLDGRQSTLVRGHSRMRHHRTSVVVSRIRGWDTTTVERPRGLHIVLTIGKVFPIVRLCHERGDARCSIRGRRRTITYIGGVVMDIQCRLWT